MKEPLLADDAFLADVQTARVEPGLRLWWLGQSGFLVQFEGHHLLIDPYLSDSAHPQVRGHGHAARPDHATRDRPGAALVRGRRPRHARARRPPRRGDAESDRRPRRLPVRDRRARERAQPHRADRRRRGRGGRDRGLPDRGRPRRAPRRALRRLRDHRRRSPHLPLRRHAVGRAGRGRRRPGDRPDQRQARQRRRGRGCAARAPGGREARRPLPLRHVRVQHRRRRTSSWRSASGSASPTACCRTASGSAWIEKAEERLGDAGRLLLALELDRRRHARLLSARDVVDVLDP